MKQQREPKFIWGIKSYDDVTGRPADLYTLNDFDIYYRYDTKSYYYDIETIYTFKSEDGEVEYLKEIFKRFTAWMRENGYKTNFKPSLYLLFSVYPQGGGFESIEELYAHFKLMCMGYARMHSQKKGKKRED